MDSEPDGSGPEEIWDDPLTPGVVVGTPVELEIGGGTVKGTGLPVTGVVGDAGDSVPVTPVPVGPGAGTVELVRG